MKRIQLKTDGSSTQKKTGSIERLDPATSGGDTGAYS